MQITDILTLPATGKSQATTKYVVNVQTGALVITYNTDGASSSVAATVTGELLVPADTILTFALNGDTATITRL